jgi:asparagine synthase (glutamine-hydrolysing)
VSAIFGAIDLGDQPRPIAPEVVERMAEALAHRGSRQRLYTANGVALGERADALPDRERPATNEDGEICAVSDGTILNERELRRELTARGHAVPRPSGSSLIPHLYEERGSRFPAQVRGEFAFAVWDAARRRAVLSRDRVGAKPLYYARHGELLVFASELKAVLATGLVSADLDYEAIDAYLALGFVPGPRTLLAGVAKLSPAHSLVVDGSELRAERYWEYPTPAATRRRASVGEYAEELLSRLDESVRLRLDSPAGALLSGGLDSSVVVALMARNTSEPVKTFSAGFVAPGQANELSDARWIAGVFGTEHHEVQLPLADRATELSELVWYVDEPLADLGTLGLFALARLAGRHVAVAFSGEGADGLFGGLPAHRTAVIAGAWDRLPRPARQTGEWLLARGSARARRARRVLAAPDPAARYLVAAGPLTADHRARLVRGRLAALDGGNAQRAVRDRLRDLEADPLATYIYIDQQLVDADGALHAFDRTGNAGGLEMRLPFYDHHVLEFAATVPNRLKVRRLTGKYLLRHAARGLVPDRVIDRKKIGFLYTSLPAWLRAQIPGAISEFLLAPSPRYGEFLERAEIERMVRDHAESADPQHSTLLLSLLLLEIWLATYLPRALGPPIGAGERAHASG